MILHRISDERVVGVFYVKKTVEYYEYYDNQWIIYDEEITIPIKVTLKFQDIQ